jgi:hypothetical protein
MGQKLSVDEMLATATSREDKIFLIQVIGQRDIKRLVKTIRAMLAVDLKKGTRL